MEMVVVVAIMLMISSFFMIATRWNRNALANVSKTDLTAKLRNSSLLLSHMLSHSTRILFPSTVSSTFVNQIVFRNSENELVALYVNPENQLCMYNYSKGEGKDITPYTISLKARLANENLLEFVIMIKKDNYEFTISDRLSTSNTLP